MFRPGLRRGAEAIRLRHALPYALTLCALAGCSGTDDEARRGAGGSGGVQAPDGAGGAFTGTGAVPGTGAGAVPGSGTGGMQDALPPGTTMVDDCQDPNPAGLDAATVTALKAGGAPTGARMLYPYDGTVLPRGLESPLLMWDGAQADAVYVHLVSGSFEYHGCLSPTAAGQLQFPQAAWDAAAAASFGPADPFTLEVTFWSGGAAAGPLTQQLIIAQATLKGSVYYNSYMSALPGAQEGAVLRVRPGQGAELFAGQTGCTGCHSVSANGARMITKRSLVGGEVVALAPNTPVNPAPLRTGATFANFVGLAPDGSVYINTAGDGLHGPHDDFMLVTNTSSMLFDTDSGNEVAGSGVSTSAMMPTFSADGDLLVFTDLASGGQSLALQDFDLVGRSATGQRTIYTAPSGYPGWPFITPDDRAVIFALGSDPTFATGGGLATSDLYIVDIASGQATMLARAMGYATPQDAASGTTYLPFGAEELQHHFYPTVSPVAAGGYFWVFFDSVRHYGNRGLERQLWGAAVRVSADGTYAGDPSHPPFYLPGQEFGTDNHRAFAALDPCRDDGQGCESGVDCCSGFCTDGVCGPPQGCSETDEACTTTDDCCNPADICIGGFCGQVVVE